MPSRLSRVNPVAVLLVVLMATVVLSAWAAFGAISGHRAANAALRAVSAVLLTQQQVHELQYERGMVVLRAATTGHGPDTAEFDGITGRIAELNQRGTAATTEVADAALRDGVRALEDVGEVKEATAQLRGFLGGVFAAGAFAPQEYARFTAMRASKQAALTHFDRMATASRRTELHAAQSSAAAAHAARYERIAIGASDGRLPTPVDPAAWWTVMTAVIDDLRGIQQTLADDISRDARRLQQVAVRDLGLFLVLGTTATAAEITLYSRRSTGRSDAAQALITELHSALLGGATTVEAWRLVARRLTELSLASCVLILCTDGGRRDRARFTVCAGLGAEELLGMRTAIENSCVIDVLSTGAPVVIDDLEDHLRVAAGAFGPSVAMPLRAGSRVRGVLLAARGKRDPAFTTGHLTQLSLLTDQAAAALELAENQEAKRWSDLLDDRDRIAHEMYYLVITRLVDAGMLLQGTVDLISHPRVRDRVGAVISQLDDVARQMRTSIFDLQVSDHHESLRQRLLHMVVETAQSAGLELAVYMPKTVDTVVSAELADDIEAVVREATSNVVRHANATELALTVETTDDLIICVADNGAGITDTAVRGGLGDLAQRATRRGGTLSISREPAGGTRLTWRVPLRR